MWMAGELKHESNSIRCITEAQYNGLTDYLMRTFNHYDGGTSIISKH